MPVREAVRALLKDPDGSLFLMRIIEPVSQQPWWISPGGGRAPGEAPLAALCRELYEELGVTVKAADIGPVVWHRRVAFSWSGKQIDQHETFYLIETPRFDPPRCEDGDGATALYVGEPHWWSHQELERSEENIAPSELAEHWGQLLANGVPSEPIDISPIA